MRHLPAVFASTVLALVASAGEPTSPSDYAVLSDEARTGSAFVVRHADHLLGVATVHQFDGKVPTQFESTDGRAIRLDPDSVHKQKDVQALKLIDQKSDVQFLEYDATFRISSDDEIIILGPAGREIEAHIPDQDLLEGDDYESDWGAYSLDFTASEPFDVSNMTGCPVLLKSTGKVIGVLLTTSRPIKATRGEFETLCLTIDEKAHSAQPK